jgi:ubiquinone/menaquinone biosynthesis C-methylase UbiE
MHHSREDYQRFHRRRHGAVLAALERHVPEPVARALDIGGGGDVAGAGAVIRKRFARELHAVDTAEDAAVARAQGVLAEACNVDLEPLPYTDGFFDLVLFCSVIEHLYNPFHALAEITRVLAPGGLLLLEAPNAVALGRRLDLLLGRNPFRWFNAHNAGEKKAFMVNCSVFYTAEEVEGLLADGFELVEGQTGMHNPPVNPFKRILRETAYRINPRFGDWFFVVARKR